jgi:hypothetical protein
MLGSPGGWLRRSDFLVGVGAGFADDHESSGAFGWT